MSRRCSLLSKPLSRVTFVLSLLLILAVVVPLVALAETGEAEKPPQADLQPVAMPTDLHPGDWTQTEPWASILTGEASGSEPRVSTSFLDPILWYDDMESGEGSWTKNGTWALTEEWGGTNHSPTHAWSDSPGGYYSNYAGMSIYSPTIDLSSVASYGSHAQIIFNVRLDTEYPYPSGSGSGYVYTDYLQVRTSGDDGSSWDWGKLYFGEGEGYILIDVPDECLTSNFKVRFAFVSDYSITYDGVYIDDLAVLTTPDEYVQESDSRLTYLGDWTVEAGPYGSWYTHSYADVPGSAVVVDFTGTGLEWYGTVGPNYGIANVSLDGGPPVQVDLYNPTAVYYYPSSYPQETLLRTSTTWGNLPDGPHTMVIWSSGQKNVLSSGYRISVDRFNVWGAATQSPATVSCEQDDGDLEYMGPWTTTSDAGASGGSLAVANAAGSSLNVSFEGTYLAWFAKKGPGYGKAWVSLDGGPLEMVDLYNAWNSSRKRVYHTGPLSDDGHTLSIYWSGEKNSSAWGTTINADSFEVLGAFTDADPAEPITWRYQQTDSRITYLGNWSTSSTWSASGGSHATTGQTGAAAIVKFTGTEVDVVAATGPSYGEANIYVDGTLVDTIDLYNPSTAWKVPVYSDDSLSEGEHTLIVECTGDKNASSSGKTVNLDAFDILGTAEQAPSPTRFDDNDGTCTNYAPAWSRWDSSGYWAAYLDTYAFTDKETYRMAVAFEGTHLSWVSRTANTQGKAKVTLDGNDAEAVIIDLYSPGTSWKKRVYSTGILDDTSHYVTIECLGEKNPSSWWYTIGIDAFDIMGTTTGAPPIAPAPIRYQQTDAKVTYLGGGWSTTSNSSASGQSYASTSQKGAVALAEFTGIEVGLLASTGPGYGEADIYVDDVLVDTVDLYSPSTAWKVPIYGDDMLAPGSHTIAIECTGDKNSSSSGTTVNLDALDLTGSLDQPDTPTRIDDNDTSYATYDPAWPRWDSSGYWAAYLDTYAFTDQGTNKVTITFHGTHLSWVSRYSNTQGQAEVKLYNGTVDPGNLVSTQTIDLYSPSTTWKKRVYSTGLLDDSTYTVVIECLGTKNPSSWWYTIGVDAFDIMETAP